MRFKEFATDSSESLMSIALLIGQQHQEGDPAMTMDAFLEKLDNAGINMNIESFRQAYETDSNVQSVVNELIRSNKLDGAELEFKPDAIDDTPDERVSKMARKAVKTRENEDKYNPHYMYKGTKKDYKAKFPTTKKYHDRLGKSGYDHDDPETKKKEEGKMKGGSDFYKFMGYKDLKNLDKDNRQLPKVIAVEPFKNQGAQLKKLGNKAQGYGYYDEDASDRTSWVLRKNTKTTEGSRPGKLSKGHPNYKKQAAAIAISKQNAK
jgi:hypothetical protein